MLTGSNPFRGDTGCTTLINQVTQPIPQLNDHLAQFQPLLNLLLAKQPDDRFFINASVFGLY